MHARSLRLLPGLLIVGCALAVLGGERLRAVAPPTVDDKAVKDAETRTKLYGDQGGEMCEPADDRKPNTVLRAGIDDVFYKIMDVAVEGESKLIVQYEAVRRGSHPATHLVIHFPDGENGKLDLHLPKDREHGVVRIAFQRRGPFGKFAGPGKAPTDAEFYFIRSDAKYTNEPPVFKVSNSHVMGDMPVTTKARDWTPQEIARITHEPDPGVDTPFAGGPGEHANVRLVDDSAPMLGIQYRTGAWADEKCFGDLQPIHRDTKPSPFLPTKVVAKEGYAVSGAEVQSQKYVDAIKLHFRKLRADGSLDPSDEYQSEWFGEPSADAKVTKIEGDGRRVIGIALRRFAVVDSFALVLESKKAASADRRASLDSLSPDAPSDARFRPDHGSDARPSSRLRRCSRQSWLASELPRCRTPRTPPTARSRSGWPARRCRFRSTNPKSPPGLSTRPWTRSSRRSATRFNCSASAKRCTAARICCSCAIVCSSD